MGAMPGMMSRIRSREGMPLAGPGNIGTAQAGATSGDGVEGSTGGGRGGAAVEPQGRREARGGGPRGWPGRDVARS